MSDAITGMRVAERLYYDSAELEFSARVTDIRLFGLETGTEGQTQQIWQMALDRTAFYPESGGQPWDTGTLTARARSGALLEVRVERVEDAAGEVWHFVRKPLTEGAEVVGRVDAARRMDHAQQHSGQHLLSAVLRRRLGARTVSFHLGTEGATIDVSLPEGVASLSEAEVEGLELEVNELIYANRAIRVRWVTREEGEAMLARGELAKLPERTGPLRVVEIEGVEWNACGGTHVAGTGAIGGLLLRRVERGRHGWRVEFVCGLRAVRAARMDFALLREAANRLTVGVREVPQRAAAMLVEIKAGAKREQALLEELAEAKAGELLRSAGESGLVRAVLEGRSLAFGRRVAALVTASGRSALLGVLDREEAAIVLAAGALEAWPAGEVLREVLNGMGGRGGGSKQLAHGTCRPEEVDLALRTLAERVQALGADKG